MSGSFLRFPALALSPTFVYACASTPAVPCTIWCQMFVYFQIEMTNTTNYEKNDQDFYSRIKDSKPNCFNSKIQELFHRIENEDLMQDLNIKPLKIVEDANFSLCNRPFPKEAFVVRGKAANRICKLKDDVSKMWNGGDVNIESFMKKYSKAENARNEGNGSEGFESTKTVSFQIERNNLQLELSPE